MTSGRRARSLRRSRPAGPVAPSPAPTASPKRRDCWRCGHGCRSDKHPYGWVCRNCADELDRYYVLLMGLRGGSVETLFTRDLANGQVPMHQTILRPGNAPPIKRKALPAD
jgi:hypothetical protein